MSDLETTNQDQNENAENKQQNAEIDNASVENVQAELAMQQNQSTNDVLSEDIKKRLKNLSNNGVDVQQLALNRLKEIKELAAEDSNKVMSLILDQYESDLNERQSQEYNKNVSTIKMYTQNINLSPDEKALLQTPSGAQLVSSLFTKLADRGKQYANRNQAYNSVSRQTPSYSSQPNNEEYEKFERNIRINAEAYANAGCMAA